jgi:hypothetical protein
VRNYRLGIAGAIRYRSSGSSSSGTADPLHVQSGTVCLRPQVMNVSSSERGFVGAGSEGKFFSQAGAGVPAVRDLPRARRSCRGWSQSGWPGRAQTVRAPRCRPGAPPSTSRERRMASGRVAVMAIVVPRRNARPAGVDRHRSRRTISLRRTVVERKTRRESPTYVTTVSAIGRSPMSCTRTRSPGLWAGSDLAINAAAATSAVVHKRHPRIVPPSQERNRQRQRPGAT